MAGNDASTITIRLNGKPLSLERGASVADLLARLGLPERGAFAVERNRRVVRRADHAHTELEDGDQLEIVTFVGGG